MNRPYRLPNAAIGKKTELRYSQGFLPRGWIDGLVLSNGTDTTNDLNIAAGVARSTSNMGPYGRTTLSKYQMDLEIPESITKQLDVVWAPNNGPGSITGGRSSASLADGTWHNFVIGGAGRPTDVIQHTSADPSSILPAGYTAWRRIGSIPRSTSLRQFTQFNNEFRLTNSVLSVNGASQTTTDALRVLDVPLGIKVKAIANVRFSHASQSSVLLYISPPDAADEAPSASATPLNVGITATGVSGVGMALKFEEWTNTSGEWRFESSATVTLHVATLGWHDMRGRDAA